jgi:hypothetical protein
MSLELPRRMGDNMRVRGIALLSLLALALTASACSWMEAPRKAEEARQEAWVEHAEINHIWVTTGIPKRSKPYSVLGPVDYTEPFSADAIDTMHIEQKLRELGLQKWPNSIDAIIDERFKVSDDGTQVAVRGQAIQYKSSTNRAEFKQDLLDPNTPDPN